VKGWSWLFRHRANESKTGEVGQTLFAERFIKGTSRSRGERLHVARERSWPLAQLEDLKVLRLDDYRRTIA
jgi:hypothetical protein